jgi:hypothetical protein
VNPQGELSYLQRIVGDLVNSMQETLASGGILDDELQGAIARELEIAYNRMETLRGQIIPTPSPPTPAQQLMWILAGQREDVFVNYLNTYPDPELQRLLRNPTELERVVVQLHEMMPSGRPPVSQEGIPHAEINSSNIYGFQYDPSSRSLRVKFQGDGPQGGPVYEYDNVPLNVYKAFETGSVPAKTNGQNNFGRWWQGKMPSLGAAFYELIRNGGYAYRRVE